MVLICTIREDPIPPRNEGEFPEMLIDSINYVLSSYDHYLHIVMQIQE